MGMKVRILDSKVGHAIESILMTSVIGNAYSAQESNDGLVKVYIDQRGFWLILGQEVVPYTEEIFSDKEYEELWV